MIGVVFVSCLISLANINSANGKLTINWQDNLTVWSQQLVLLRSANAFTVKNAGHRTSIVLINSENDVLPIPPQFHHRLNNEKMSIYIVSIQARPMFFQYRDNLPIKFLMYLDTSLSNLREMLHRMHYFILNDPERSTVFVDLSSSQHVTEYFQLFMQNGVVSVTVLRVRPETDNVVDVYHWNHVEKNFKCKNKLNSYKKIGWYSLRNNSYTLTEGDKVIKHYFPIDAKNVSSNCTLRVGAVIYPPFVVDIDTNITGKKNTINLTRGFEVKMMRVISKHLGLDITFKVSHHPLHWGYLQQNGSATGIFQDLLHSKIDLAISSFTYLPWKQYLDFSPPYAYEHMIWCVPESDDYYYLHIAPLFLLFLSVFLLSSITIWLLSKFSKNEPKYNQDWVNCLLRLATDPFWTASFAPARSNKLKLFILLWVIYLLHLSVLSSARLYSEITVKLKHTPYDSVDDVLNSDLRLQILSNTEHILSYNGMTKGKYQICNNITTCIHRVAQRKDSAVCLTGSLVQHLQPYHLPINCLRRTIFYSYPLTIIYRKKFYLGKRVNNKISALFEGGLVDLWRKNAIMKYSNKQRNYFVSRNQMNDPFISFTIYDLKFAFIVLLEGYVASITVFLIEIVWLRLRSYFVTKPAR